MKLNFKKLLPVCLLCLLFPISRVSAVKPEVFTPEQCQAIIQYVADHGGPGVFKNWVGLKRELHLPQTSDQILHKYTYSLNPRINRGPWTAAEDRAILGGVETHGRRWALIAETMGTGRTDMQVSKRFVFSLNPTLKKGQFTDEEDQKIRNWVAANGPKNWEKCARELFGDTRNRKQLRERWTNCLNPNLKKGLWTAAEDQIITQQVDKVGTKWKYISELLPGRSANAIKNRWNHHLNKKSLGDALPKVKANQTDRLLDPQTATSGNDDFVTDFSFTPVESTVGSPLFAPPPISPLQSPIDWSFLNSTQNSSEAQPAPVPGGSGNNSIPNLNLSAQNPPTVPTQSATPGNGDSVTNSSSTPVDNNTNNNDFTLFSFESPLDQALDYNLGLPGSFDYFDFPEFK